MELPSYFIEFLAAIRPQDNHVEDYKTGHKTLRKRLKEYEDLSSIIVTTFLQGSYRRASAIRPQGDKRADVDVIVVTRLSEDEYTPIKAMELFIPFLDKYYKGKYESQGRSFGIELSYVDLDLVITSAPLESEVGVLQADSVSSDDTLETSKADDDWRLSQSWLSIEARSALSFSDVQYRLDAAKREAEWKLSPLRIPDRDTEEWQDTHPLEQIRWTWDKNRKCNKHYINVVKALKWWRRENHPTPKYPKGYPVEHLIGECCPDGIKSVAEGITKTLEAIAHNYKWYALQKITPNLPDRGVPSHNVFKRVSGEDFAEFHSQVCEAAEIARQALDETDLHESVKCWQQLFGKKFDTPPQNSNGSIDGGRTPSVSAVALREGANSRDLVAAIKSIGVSILNIIPFNLPYIEKAPWRFDKHRISVAIRADEYSQEKGNFIRKLDSGMVMQKERSIRFEAYLPLGLPRTFFVRWRVVNTGEEAVEANGLRGGFYKGDSDTVRWESTSYTGVHWVEAFVVNQRTNTCMGKSDRFFVVIE